MLTHAAAVHEFAVVCADGSDRRGGLDASTSHGTAEGCRGCRYTLYEVKEELLDAMGLNTEEEGSALQFLRRGYKTSTWWEDDEDVEKSDAWRT